MIVIDIAQRDASRRYDFQPSYGRRADSDKPGKVWRQENDGPAPDRQAQSDAIRARVTRKRLAAVAGLPDGVTKVVRLLADGGMKVITLAQVLGCTEATARDRVGYARSARLIESDKKGVWSLTAAGRAWLEAV